MKTTEVDPLNIENWYSNLEKFTFETKFISISQETAQAFLNFYDDPKGKSKFTNKDKILLEKLEEELDSFIDRKIGSFIRLSTRSPKDSALASPKLENLMKQYLNSLNNDMLAIVHR
jgi:hypothetical protein